MRVWLLGCVLLAQLLHPQCSPKSFSVVFAPGAGWARTRSRIRSLCGVSRPLGVTGVTPTPGPERPTRAMLTEMLTHLYRILAEDWEEAQPTVFTTAQWPSVLAYFPAHYILRILCVAFVAHKSPQMKL